MKSRLLFGYAAAFALCAAAHAGIIQIGSPIMFGGTNDPATYSDPSTFSSTPALVDNGAVQIWQQQTATSGGGEWDIFYMQIVNGGPLAGDINANWNITIDYTLSQAAYFDGVESQWLVDGTPVSPINNFSGICCATDTPPVLQGPAYYNSGFSALLPAGEQTNWQQIYSDPYNTVAEGGIDPSTADEFAFALHFTPVSVSTPEPSSVSLMVGGGLIGLALIWRRRKRA